MNERDSFRVEGVGCWCPGEMTLYTLRAMGHTEKCTQARRGWEANYRHMTQDARRRAENEEVGRQIREAAQAIIEREQSES